MIKFIVGHKGSGKTKTMISMANEASANSKGNVVCIEKGIQLTYDLSHKVRLVDVDAYGISGYDSYYGFLCGLMAGNYDISHVFCDAVFKVCGNDFSALEQFALKMNKLMVNNETEVILTLSCEPEEIPASIKEFII